MERDPGRILARHSGHHAMAAAHARMLFDCRHQRPPEAAAMGLGRKDDGVLHGMNIAVTGPELVIAGKAQHPAIIRRADQKRAPRRMARRDHGGKPRKRLFLG